MALLTINEVKKELGISRGSVYVLIENGELHAMRHRLTGGRGAPRIDSADVEAYKQRLRADSESEHAGGGGGAGVATSAERVKLKKKPPPSVRLSKLRHYE